MDLRISAVSDDTGVAAFEALSRPSPMGRSTGPAPDATRLVAFRGDEPVARCAVRTVADLHGAPGLSGTIGFYEARDGAAGAAVLEAAKAELAGRGVARVLGPMDGTTWDRYRFALPDPSGDDPPPFFTEPTNPPEYPSQWEAAGFEVAERYLSRLVADLDSLAERGRRATERLAGTGIEIAAMSPGAFGDTLDEIHGLSVESFAENAYYSPIGRDRFRAMYAPIESIVDPSLVLLARDAGGGLVGFIFNVPDLLDPAIAEAGRPTRLIMKSMAVAPSARGSGLGALLMHESQRLAAEKGYAAAIHALMHADNNSLRISRDGGDLYREYALYRWTP